MPFDDIVQRVRALLTVAAQEELVPRFAEVSRMFKADGSLVTAADHAMQERMALELGRLWPQYAFLGEEMPEEEQLGILHDESGAGLWCLDPLDGTSNFVNGIPFFTTSLALVIGGEPVIGWVYDPIRDECFVAQKGRGAELNDVAVPPPPYRLPLKRCMAAIDLKRLSAPLGARLGQAPPYASQRSFGSSALEWCWLAAGRLQVYLHGAQKIWDYAAGVLILSESGARSRTLDGEAVFARELGARSVLAARDPGLFESWQAWVAANRG